MILRVYAVLDSKIKYYGEPKCLRNAAEATRMFVEIANDKSSPVGKNPEDFILYEIGEYDAENGEIVTQPHVCLGKAIDFVRQVQ